jgi:hypothetical protein
MDSESIFKKRMAGTQMDETILLHHSVQIPFFAQKMDMCTCTLFVLCCQKRTIIIYPNSKSLNHAIVWANSKCVLMHSTAAAGESGEF